MQKAKEKTAENLSYANSIDSDERISFLDKNLKKEINNLLHTFLPDDLTLAEVDALAMTINDMVWNPRDYLTPKPQQQ